MEQKGNEEIFFRAKKRQGAKESWGKQWRKHDFFKGKAHLQDGGAGRTPRGLAETETEDEGRPKARELRKGKELGRKQILNRTVKKTIQHRVRRKAKDNKRKLINEWGER